MIPVKTMPRFKCDFCRRKSTKKAMEKHEKICWRNPNRFCETCKNSGEIKNDILGDGMFVEKLPCPYCSKKDAEKIN